MRLLHISIFILLNILVSTNAFSSQKDFLEAHNKERAKVGVAPLVWDETVASYARKYVEERKDCKLIHSKGGHPPFGESIALTTGGIFTAQDAVGLWMSEEKLYDRKSNTCNPTNGCLHYTQVLSQFSKHLGCASIRCNNGGTFISCNYDPPGNVWGKRPF